MQSQFWLGYAILMRPKKSLQTWWFFGCLKGAHPRVLAEALTQKTRHHREVGHLGCATQDTLEKSKGGEKEGKEEEKTEF